MDLYTVVEISGGGIRSWPSLTLMAAAVIMMIILILDANVLGFNPAKGIAGPINGFLAIALLGLAVLIEPAPVRTAVLESSDGTTREVTTAKTINWVDVDDSVMVIDDPQTGTVRIFAELKERK